MKTILQFLVVFVNVCYICCDDGRCPRPDEIAPCQCRTRGPSIQVRCVNSMMGRIMEAMMNIRKRVDLVDVLILENNNIPHLPSRAFGSVKVNRLFIENNRIQTIDRNAFAGVEDYLTEIYIKEPSLKQLPRDSIDYLKKLSVFSIDSSQISEMPTVVGLQQLKLFKIDGSNITDIPARSLKDLPGLRYLHVANAKLRRLEVGLLENLPFLVLANFTGNEISWIHPRAFRYMEQMEELVLAQNDIRDAVMVGQAVKVIKTIKKLDLSNNRIDKLRDGSFIDIISLEEMTLANNRLTLMQRDAFHRLPRLKKIDLSNNEIRTFHSEAFSNTPVIEELLLNNNQLSKVTDISFMIDSLPMLRFLDLSRNLIEDIPYGALRGYPKLEKLYIAENQIGDLSEDAFQDLPSLMELDLSKNKLTSRSIDGTVFNLPNLKTLDVSFNKLSQVNQKLLESLSSLKRLNLAQNGITDVEDGSLQRTKNLDYLNISYNNLREISPRLFEGLSNLFELDLSHNELVTLTDHTFIDQRDLEFVNLSNNQIQLVSSHLFPKLNRIRFLDFSANFITNFPSEMIKRLNYLTRLLFRRNSIQSLDSESFEGLTNLELIDLHDNRIQDIDNRAFSDLKSLKSLDLSLNVISTVGSSVEPLTNLMKLNLSDNYITTLPFTAFRSLNRLSTLDISNNTIVDIGEAFVNMPEIKFLDLSYNHLPSIRTGAFKKMPKLLSLHLDHNSVIRIEPDAFQELWDLEKLYLTKNGISNIRTDTFRTLPSLEKLYLDDNLIKELDERSFQNLLSLKELHLEYNLIKTINERAFHQIPSIRYLNLSYNLMQDLSRYGFYGLETLETIDLSFNDIRIVDDRAFDNLKWLVHLKLNDNNICKITGKAFKDSNSLRRLNLNNNRIYRLQESSFMNIKRNVDTFHVSGNPLNCDCETKWLRNWVSTQQPTLTHDEPRCYFPKALSGNPLRQLRSSRFTCSHQGSSLISDACNSLPLKTPAQLHMTAVTNAGIPENLATFNIQFGGPTTTINEIETSPVTAQLEDDDEANKVVDLVNEVIDSEIEAATEIMTTTEESNGDDDYMYEYVYYYYDEDGVNGTVVDVKPANSLTKIQNISAAAVNIHTNIGDTPTIYAGASNHSDIEKIDTSEESGGLTIFGIPIPSIPISLSFGLAPAISQVFSNGGLIPLGRKGEASQEKHSIGKRPSSLGDQTRGPDTQVPVWVDQFKKIDFKKMAALFPNVLSPKKKDTVEVERNQQYGYLEPKNPIIPLSGEVQNDPRSSGYFPFNAQSPKGYFPTEEDDMPILKFDHPIHPLRNPNQPISPPKAGDRLSNFYQQRLHKKPIEQRPIKSEGFHPMFIPNNRDGNVRNPQDFDYNVLNQPSLIKQKRPAFPGIEATIRNQYLEIPTERTPPSLDFEEIAPEQEYNYYENTQYEHPQYEDSQYENLQYESNPPYEAIPEYLEEYDYLPDDKFMSRSTQRPPLDSTKKRQPQINPETTEYNEIVTDTESYKMSTAAETTTEYDPRKDPVYNIPIKTKTQKEKEFVERLLNQNKLEGVEIYEVTSKNPVKLQSTEVNIDIDVSHNGTPKQDLITTENPRESTVENMPEYEYEYVYEYYDDEEELEAPTTTVQAEEPATTTEKESTSRSSLMSILNFLNKDSTTFASSPQTTTRYQQVPMLPQGNFNLADLGPVQLPQGNFNLAELGPVQLPQHRQTEPTLLPAIRSSTFLYDVKASYPEVQRSTVTVEIEDRFGRSRSSISPERGPTARSSSSSASPYPFHPDRLDPASPPNSDDGHDNSVNWYYSSYNHENTDPYIGPGPEQGSSSGFTLDYSVIIPIVIVVTNLLVL